MASMKKSVSEESVYQAQKSRRKVAKKPAKKKAKKRGKNAAVEKSDAASDALNESPKKSPPWQAQGPTQEALTDFERHLSRLWLKQV